jgi:hypothetical protein
MANKFGKLFAISLLQNGKAAAFAWGECKDNVHYFATKLYTKACRLFNYETWEQFTKFLHRKVGNFQKHKTTLYLFQLICATVKGNLERPLEVSCLPAQEVEAALEARLISTTVGPGASTVQHARTSTVSIDSSTASSSRSQCYNIIFCLSTLEK